MNYPDVPPRTLDLLKELFNIGAGNAANTISLMNGDKVLISVPEINICKLSEVSRFTGEMEREMIGVHHDISGGLSGRMLLLISRKSGEEIAKSLLQRYSMSDDSADFVENALKEFSNIIIGACLTALSTMLGERIVHSIPSLAIDMTGALIDGIVATLAEKSDRILVLKSIISGSSGIFEIYFLFFPSDTSLEKLIDLG